MRLVVAAAVSFAMSAPPAGAQTDFGRLQVQPGDLIYVTPPSGVEVAGPLTRISPFLLEIDGHQFKPEPGLEIERRGDSVMNGMLLGLGIGAIAGVTIGAESCLHRPLWHCGVGASITYGAIGALIDWLRVGRTLIFRGAATASGQSSRVKPPVGPAGEGDARPSP